LARYRATAAIRFRNEVVEEHWGLAVTIARDFANGSEPLDDLTQVALVALVKAAERFNPTFGVPYRNFAAVTIRGELRRHLRDSCWAVHVPRRVQEMRYEVRNATQVLQARLHRSPTAPEVAEHLGVELDAVIDALCADMNFRSLSIFHADGTLTERHGAPEPGFGTIEDRDALRQATGRLPPRLRQVVDGYFGRQMTQSEIAEELGVSQVHVSRLLRTAIELLRQLLADDGLLPAERSVRPISRSDRRRDGVRGSVVDAPTVC
jgi:RNA polymerase sigma-B factor